MVSQCTAGQFYLVSASCPHDPKIQISFPDPRTALVWKRARAFLLLDAGEDAGAIYRILDIDPTVMMEWRFAFAGAGLSFFGLKDYSQRQGHLSVAQ